MPDKPLTHTICAELCCEGVPKKFGPGRSKLRKEVVNENPKTIKMVVVDSKGVEV
jgi:hypothetical protein